jgi:siroheme synthase-like protein
VNSRKPGYGTLSKTKPEKIYYPLYLDLQGKKSLLVGGGNIALRKASTLLECGAKVTVVSPRICAGLSELSDAGRITVIPRSYREGDLAGASVAVIATSSRKTNALAAAEARKSKILVNVVDDPQLSDFIVPSILRRGNLAISISTGGMSPALARKIRTRLQKEFGPEYSKIALLVHQVRAELKKQNIRATTRDWQQAIDLDELEELVRKGKPAKARVMLLSRLAGHPEKRIQGK